MIAIGCDMARQCHLNTCPTGIATQREDLRAKFTGVPEQVIHFFAHVAQDVRETLAALGARTLDEVIGRCDLLRQKSVPGQPRTDLLDLSAVLAQVDPEGRRPRRCLQPRNDRAGYEPVDDEIIPLALPALERGEPFSLSLPIRNSQRTAGARLSGAIALRYGDAGLPEGTVRLRFTGSAGQSFGAFLAPGVQLSLQGEANDYVGKGMHGGQIAVFPPRRPLLRRTATPSSATPSSTAPREAASSLPGGPASASPCATAGPRRWSRAPATIAAST